MKTYLTLAVATLALAACGQKAGTEADATPTATDTAVATPVATTGAATGSMVGTYELTSADGTRMTETIRPDGTFSMISEGKETTGRWRMDGERSCFDPEGADPEVCYTTSPVAADGSFTVTHPDGSAMTARKVAAAPAM